MREQMNSCCPRSSPRAVGRVRKGFDYPVAWLDDDAFAAIKVKEEDAERAVGEAKKQDRPARLLH